MTIRLLSLLMSSRMRLLTILIAVWSMGSPLTMAIRKIDPVLSLPSGKSKHGRKNITAKSLT